MREGNPMIAIIDYGAGNLRSVAKAVANLSYEAEVTDDPRRVLAADVVILPGVGAAGDTMESLRKLGLVEPIKQVIVQGRPFLGICLGLQVLFTSTEESGGYNCLNLIPGTVRLLPPNLKVPHMGWNQLKQKMAHPVFNGISDEANFYFVHSYYVDPLDRSIVAGETGYGIDFCSMAVKGNLVATQFHPEKSGEIGLRLLGNFLKLSLGKGVEC
jgi:glutamine amidotransferase